MQQRKITPSDMIFELVEAGEWINRGGDYFEDMGGHLVHESSCEDYFTYYLENLSVTEREEVIDRLTGEES